MNAPLIAALSLSASVAHAQGAQDIYDASFLGAYARGPICAGQELQVDLMSDEIGIGETKCAISGVLTDGVGIILDLASCNAEGEPAEDRRVTLTLTEGGLTYDSTATGVIQLQRCTDR